MGYSFRFYGRSPGDWYEGANDGHTYELQFRALPTAEQRAALATCYEDRLASGPARPASRPWQWSERFARFEVGERWSSASGATFAKVADFLVAAHELCPLVDVVFWGMRAEGTSAWDRWTIAVQAEPDPGPAYDPTGGVRRVDSTLPVATVDAAFESARAAARAQLQERAIAQANDGKDVRLEPFPAERVPPSVDPKLRELFGTPSPAQVTPPGSYSRFVDGYHPVDREARPIACRKHNASTVGWAYLEDGAVRDVAFPDGQIPGPYFTTHHDGDRALAHVQSDVYEVDFASGRATPRWRMDEPLLGLAWLGDLWVIRGESKLYVVDPASTEPRVVASTKAKGDWLAVVRDGTVIVTGEFMGKPRLFAYAEGKLKKIAGLETKLSEPREVDGRVLLWAYDAQAWFAVTGLDEAVEACAAPLRERAEKARRKAAKSAGAPPA